MPRKTIVQHLAELSAKGTTPDLTVFDALQGLGDKVRDAAILAHLQTLNGSIDTPARDYVAEFKASENNVKAFDAAQAAVLALRDLILTARKEQASKISVEFDLTAEDAADVLKLTARTRKAREAVIRNYDDLAAALDKAKITNLYISAGQGELRQTTEIRIHKGKASQENPTGFMISGVGPDRKPFGMLPTMALAAVRKMRGDEKATTNAWRDVKTDKVRGAGSIEEFLDNADADDDGDSE